MCKRLIIAGRGVRIANAIEELRQFALWTNIPVATTFLGKDTYHKSVGCIGIKGEANRYLEEADELIIIGASIPIAQLGYDYKRLEKKHIIYVNIEPPHTLISAEFIKSDAKRFLRRTIEAFKVYTRAVEQANG